jgi:GNAT superfamily N-acetyltransferase
LLFGAFAEYESLYTPDGFAATAITTGQIARRMAEGPVWVAVSGETIVGTASVTPNGDSLYVRGMAVLPSARGQRIGELLLTHIEQFAASESFRRLTLSTTPFLFRAIRLYEHFGFQRTDEGPHELFGTPLLSMQKILFERSPRRG